MKVLFHRIISVIMTLLLLASTTSWKVDKHYCMGHLVDLAFFADAQDCGMKINGAEGAGMACCDDETIIIDAQDDLTFLLEDVDGEPLVFTADLPQIHTISFQIHKVPEVLRELHPPPLLVKDIALLHEVFLI